MRNSGNRNLLIGLAAAAAGVAALAAMNRRRNQADVIEEVEPEEAIAGTTHLSVTVVNRPRPKILVFPEDLSLDGLAADVTLHWTIDPNLAGWTFAVPPIAWKNPGPAANAFHPPVMVGDREFTILAKNPRDNRKYRYDLTLISPEGRPVSRDPSVKNRPPVVVIPEIERLIMHLLELAERFFIVRPDRR